MKTRIEQHLTPDQLTALDPATGWTDLAFPPTAVNPPGGVVAATYNINESTLDFPGNADSRLDVNYQMPHEWDVDSPVYFHLHTIFSTSETNKNSVWSVKWRVLQAYSGGAIPAWTTDAPAIVAIPSAQGPTILNIKTFTPSGCGISCIIQIQLTRLASSNASDNYTGSVQVTSLDCHYKKLRALGSRTPTSL